MVDNKELIKPLLTFPKPGDSFYFIQVLQRKKDHKGKTLGGSNNNSRLIKPYFIKSIEHLEIHWEEMVKLAEVFNARVCINLNPRSFEKAGFQVLAKIANQMSNGDFYNIRKAYDSICGHYHAEMDKRWIVDIDEEDMDKVSVIRACINQLHLEITNKPYNVLAEIPSKTGLHIISNPFNLARFSQEFPEIECHKNNPVNLYIC